MCHFEELGVANGVVELWYGGVRACSHTRRGGGQAQCRFQQLVAIARRQETMNKQGMVIVGGKPSAWVIWS